MKKPIIIAVDDDPQVIRAVSRDLKNRYRGDYRIVSTDSAAEALEALVTMKNQGSEVALFLSDQKMPQMLGVDFLDQAKSIFPRAKRVLLTAYSDTDAAIKAINTVQLDYYLMKPWDPPEEKMYPILDDLLDEWITGFTPQFEGIRVIGHQYSPNSHRIKDYLAGNLFPYRWHDVELSELGRELISSNSIQSQALPAVFFQDGSYLSNPSISEIAEKLGLNPKANSNLYDVIIIGAGPAGLAAAVYGASEGLKTLIVEKHAPGGQAGTSSRIENYLGFPKGLSGSELARRATTQAKRLGAELLTPAEVKEIKCNDQYKILSMADGTELTARSIVITTGVDYRTLETKGIPDFTGAGVYYGAAMTEANACRDREIYVIGGGNSASQGAMYLSQFAKKVSILVRKPDLSATMSTYLIEQINNTENIEVCPYSEVQEAIGEENLKALLIEDIRSNELRRVETSALFIFIGAKPFTEWMGETLLKDEKGFLKTGGVLLQDDNFKRQWSLVREPLLLETSTPGIFAAGDVRSGAMNRVASAVGEGAMSISLVHKYLQEV